MQSRRSCFTLIKFRKRLVRQTRGEKSFCELVRVVGVSEEIQFQRGGRMSRLETCNRKSAEFFRDGKQNGDEKVSIVSDPGRKINPAGHWDRRQSIGEYSEFIYRSWSFALSPRGFSFAGDVAVPEVLSSSH